MKIAFRRIHKTPLEFELTQEDLLIKGTLEHFRSTIMLMKANITGTYPRNCDVCATEIKCSIDEEVKLYINDGIYEGSDNELLEIVEMMDEMVDIDEILNSELELIRTDYYSCEACSSREDDDVDY